MKPRVGASMFGAVVCLVSLAAAPVMGQATFESQRVTHGGFGGPVLMFSTINQENVILLGVHGGWIINLEAKHSVLLGVGAYGVMDDVPARGVLVNGASVDLGLDYGGLEVGYIHRATRLVHGGVKVFLGAGGIGYYDVEGEDEDEKNRAGFFVGEPGLFMTLNVARFLRFTGGVSYRYIGTVRLEGTRREELSNVSGVVALQIGRF